MSARTITESMKIPSRPANIRSVSSRIVGLLDKRGVDRSHIFDIRLSLEETVLNAMNHGNKKDEGLSVTISFTIDDHKIEITVEDEGAGFDHKRLPDPTKSDNILRAHGRGVYLAHKLMNSVEYNEKGNKVKLIKFFS